MPSMDAIRPKKTNSSKENKKKLPPQQKPLPTTPSSFNIKDEQKSKFIWLISIGIVVVIFIGWLLLFQGLELSTTNNTSFLSRISDNFDQLWDSLKSDILKIDKDTNINNSNQSKEQLQKLEKKVFPEFIESN